MVYADDESCNDEEKKSTWNQRFTICSPINRKTLFSTDFWLNSNGWKSNFVADRHLNFKKRGKIQKKDFRWYRYKKLNTKENHHLPQISCAHSSRYNHRDVLLAYLPSLPLLSIFFIIAYNIHCIYFCCLIPIFTKIIIKLRPLSH